jgi:hypothetical protein
LTSSRQKLQLPQQPLEDREDRAEPQWTVPAAWCAVVCRSEITAGDYQGTLVASGIGGGVHFSPATTLVTGGTGKQASGTAETCRGTQDSSTVCFSFKLTQLHCWQPPYSTSCGHQLLTALSPYCGCAGLQVLLRAQVAPSHGAAQPAATALPLCMTSSCSLGRHPLGVDVLAGCQWQLQHENCCCCQLFVHVVSRHVFSFLHVH